MAQEKEIVIKLENVSKTFHVRDSGQTIRERVFNMFSQKNLKHILALRDINLEIYKGEFFGIIGHNGSGKSTLLRIIAGNYPPDKGGKATIEGRFMRLALGAGFDNELSARENIYLNSSILGLSMKEIGRRFHQIVEFAELEDYVDTKVKYFSSGMQSRLKFAIAVQADADIFLMDEFFGGVGDLRFKEKSEEVFRESLLKGRTILHVSHNMQTIKQHCDRVLLLHRGRALALGPPEEVVPVFQELMKQRRKQVGGVKR